MNVFFYTMLLIALAFMLHLALWRIRLPKRQTTALLCIFSSVLLSGVFFMFKFPELIRWSILPSNNLFEIIQFFILFVSFAVSYIVSYPAIEVDSPTLIIIKAVSDAGPRGMDKGKLEAMMTDDLLIVPRINDMVSDKMIYLDGGRYRLMGKGLMMARVFSFYRNITGSAKGG